jgi:hypothetical protein
VGKLVAYVAIHDASLEIGVRASALSAAPSAEENRVHCISVPAQLKRGNHAMQLVVRDQATEARVPDRALVALLSRANRWFASLRTGEHDSVAALAADQHQAGRDVTRTVYLAFLAPDIVERITSGEQPIGLGVRRLLKMSPLPMDWREQRKVIGLGL